MRKFRNRNNRSAAGAYEQTSAQGAAGARGRRGFGPLDPDEAWDARVGHEADGYGYYEEQELSGGGGGGATEYHGAGGSYAMKLAPTSRRGPGGHDDDDGDEELGRGRQPTRSPGAVPPGQRNPFDDDASDSLRGVSPRPIDTAAAAAHKHTAKGGDSDSPGSENSPAERRSVFRENV